MNGNTLQRKVLITNPQGLHLRPVAAFVQLAGRYQCSVTVSKDGRAVDGRSPLGLMSLAAEPGSELIVETSGPDALDALDALAALLAAPPSENGESPEPPTAETG
jgi:phosphotransferase system HPr (HPr) family protein